MRRKAESPKHGYHHGDLRRALLDAALLILEEEGIAGLTLREVARRTGVTQAAPYHHFADKEAILAALAEEGFVKLHDAMTTARDAAGSKPAARLRAMGIAYITSAVAHPAHFRIMFSKLVCIGEHPSLHTAAEAAFNVLVEAVAAAQKAGAARRGNPVELAILSWSMVHGLAMLWVEGALQGPGGPESRIDVLAEKAGDLLLRGIAG